MMIQAASEHDLPALIDLQKQLIAFERQFDRGIRPNALYYSEEQLRELISGQRSLVLLAKDNGIAVACGFAKIVEGLGWDAFDEKGYVGMIYVAPEHRGRGVSKEIMSTLLAWFAEQGIKDIQLGVYPNNAAAVALYKRFGFEPHLSYFRKLC